MKPKDLIGLHCHCDYKFGTTGIVKDIIKTDEVGFDGRPIWHVIIEDHWDGSIETEDLDCVIFDVPYINQWEFEYLNSRWEIDGDEKYNTGKLWLDSKLSKEDVIKIISDLYSGDWYFSLRNVKIIDNVTKEWKINYK